MMGFGTKQGFPVLQVDTCKPTFIIKGGGGKISKTAALPNPTKAVS